MISACKEKSKEGGGFLPCREAFALISKLVSIPSMPPGQGLPMEQSDEQFTATFHFREITPSKRITSLC